MIPLNNIVLNGHLVDLSTPLVMSIVNITPDSFFAPSRQSDTDRLLNTIQQALNDGAKIIDIGGYSTRPGASFVSEEEELARISSALNIIRRNFPFIHLSVDTFRASVAELAVKTYGVALINDISGGTLDRNMFSMVTQLNVPYVLMHTRGTPENMQQLTHYDQFIPEVLHYFADKITHLRTLGFTKEVVIDPGFGFAKTLDQNYALLRNLRIFETFNSPLLIGVSRKSMICKLLGVQPEQALNGTTVLHTLALQNGASILRVHDVKPAVEAIKLFQAYNTHSF